MSFTPLVWYLALLKLISYGHTMYSLICADTDNIIAFSKVSQNLIGLQGSMSLVVYLVIQQAL